MISLFKRLFSGSAPTKEEPMMERFRQRDTEPSSSREERRFSAPQAIRSVVVQKPQIANIEVVLQADRTRPGNLFVLDDRGSVMSGPWPALGKAHSKLAAKYGNPKCDPMLRYGDTPTGSYQVTDILPARVDPKGIEIFGKQRVIRLRPVSGLAGMADANGRTAMLIHGGADETAPTDGSIRVPDEAMAALLALLPADPASSRPRISVEVRLAPAEARSPVQTPRSSGTSAPTHVNRWERRGADSSYDDDFTVFYQQMYLWYLLDVYDTSTVDIGQTVDPYLFVDQSQPTDPSQGAVTDPSQGDSILSDVLSDLGFEAPHHAEAAPDMGQGSPQPADTTQTSAPNAPVDAPSIPSTADIGSMNPGSGMDGWSPDGGAYGR
jgi:hypothetical protein